MDVMRRDVFNNVISYFCHLLLFSYSIVGCIITLCRFIHCIHVPYVMKGRRNKKLSLSKEYQNPILTIRFFLVKNQPDVIFSTHNHLDVLRILPKYNWFLCLLRHFLPFTCAAHLKLWEGQRLSGHEQPNQRKV